MRAAERGATRLLGLAARNAEEAKNAKRKGRRRRSGARTRGAGTEGAPVGPATAFAAGCENGAYLEVVDVDVDGVRRRAAAVDDDVLHRADLGRVAVPHRLPCVA